MRKIFIPLFSIFIITLSLTSCKKGENDPFISFQSRKARLIGEWKVTNEVITASEIHIDSNLSINSIYDGSKKMNIIVTQTPKGNTSSKDSTYYSQTLSIKKDGTYIQSIVYNNGTNLNITEGTWSFLGKSEINNLKNKEAIYLTTSKTTIYNGSGTNVYDYSNLNGRTIVIEQLKNKELIFVVDTSFKNQNTMISGKSITKTTYSTN
jgi:hypothetical protein